MCPRFSSLALICCIILAGCDDPARDRLEPGQRVFTVPFRTVDARGKTSDDVMMIGESPMFNSVGAGSEARVVADDGQADNPYRDVLVHMMEGPAKGRSGKIGRNELRPLK